jgi:curved DNA-binding protein CbpA
MNVVNMKKIIGYRKLLGVGEHADLQELKTVYRNLMKNWHPDKFVDSEELKTDAEAKSKHIIEAYHFLVSIAPETRALTFAEYTITTTTSGIADFEFKNETLQISFADGTSYEYFGVPKAIYVKLINAPAPARFARRHICNSFPYRSVSKALAV